MIGLIKKALGNGKEYFLEDDSEETEKGTAAEAGEDSESKKKGQKEEAKPTAKVSSDKAEEVKEKEEEEAKTSVKAEEGEKKKTAEKQQEKATPETSQPKVPDPLDLIIAAVNGTVSKTKTAEVNKTESFAANNLLLPTPTSRNRPGPSLNPFRDMARQVGRRS